MEKFLVEARKLAYGEEKRTGQPIKANIELATEIGKRIAKELGANVDVVEAGTLLMDCALGQALIEKRLPDHIKMSAEKADEILEKASLSVKEKENIRHCILEHHGVNKFYSLESEIVCNADCYRFVSVQGFSHSMRYMRDMPFADLVKLLNEKVAEKWNALSLDICKEELEPQHKTILEILKYLK